MGETRGCVEIDMDCRTFEELLTDYIEGDLDSQTRVECGMHRLNCHECRQLHQEVRCLVTDLGELSSGPPEVTADDIVRVVLRATSAGEMLSCENLDRLIEQYFDGVILAPTLRIFQGHFALCHKCRRLMAGIEEAIAICHELGQAEVEPPPMLPERIVAATSGVAGSLSTRLRNLLLSPQVAAVGLIFAASSLLVLTRYGSLARAATEVGASARSGIERLTRDVGRLLLTGPRSEDGVKLRKRKAVLEHLS